ncbi:MAG: AAA family ATPase [Lachnospiraceae bacterium]|nr:AAA family ATPase [Lachnospiraceae bacterium]
MTTLYQPTVFTVDGLLAQGLFILAGSPKVGKSWLALELCLSVAKGEPLLDRPTQQGSALYFCLEDSYPRIQSRLYELTDEPSDKLFFALRADTIGNGLEEQIIKFKSEHDDLRLVVIDTLQMVRNETESSYGSDYAEIVPLKNLAERLGITIVLVHHLRKAADSDPFNMISGSTGLSGATDGQLVLKKDKRGGTQAVLYVTGRDIEDQELSLTKQGARWVLADEHTEKPPDTFPFAIHDLMAKLCSFRGSATELCGLLKDRFGGEYFVNRLTRDMFKHAYELRDLGVIFEPKRSNGQRLLLLRYDKNSDSSDGKILMSEQPQTADPTVTSDDADCSETVENAASAVDDVSTSADDFTDPEPATAVPADGAADPEYVLIDGKQVPIVRFSLDDLLNRSAAKIRAQIYQERGILVPEFKLAP